MNSRPRGNHLFLGFHPLAALNFLMKVDVLHLDAISVRSIKKCSLFVHIVLNSPTIVD